MSDLVMQDIQTLSQRPSVFQRLPQAGFTLIELIVVIVIIGILAAIAIPKFADLTATAQQKATDAIAAEAASAAAIAYAKSKLDGSTAATCLTIGNFVAGGSGATVATGYVSSGASTTCTITHTGGTTATFELPASL